MSSFTRPNKRKSYQNIDHEHDASLGGDIDTNQEPHRPKKLKRTEGDGGCDLRILSDHGNERERDDLAHNMHPTKKRKTQKWSDSPPSFKKDESNADSNSLQTEELQPHKTPSLHGTLDEVDNLRSPWYGHVSQVSNMRSSSPGTDHSNTIPSQSLTTYDDKKNLKDSTDATATSQKRRFQETEELPFFGSAHKNTDKRLKFDQFKTLPTPKSNRNTTLSSHEENQVNRKPSLFSFSEDQPFNPMSLFGSNRAPSRRGGPGGYHHDLGFVFSSVDQTEDYPKQRIPQEPFRFLDLPAEIQDQIFRILLTADITLAQPPTLSFQRSPTKLRISEYNDIYRRRFSDRSNTFCPQILLANRDINARATPYLYRNTFVFESLQDAGFFLKMINNHRRTLRRVEIVTDGSEYGELRCFNDLSSLQEITLHLKKAVMEGSRPGRYTPTEVAHRLFEGLFSSWLKAAWVQKGDVKAALKMIRVGSFSESFERIERFEKLMLSELESLMNDVVEDMYSCIGNHAQLGHRIGYDASYLTYVPITSIEGSKDTRRFKLKNKYPRRYPALWWFLG